MIGGGVGRDLKDLGGICKDLEGLRGIWAVVYCVAEYPLALQPKEGFSGGILVRNEKS